MCDTLRNMLSAKCILMEGLATNHGIRAFFQDPRLNWRCFLSYITLRLSLQRAEDAMLQNWVAMLQNWVALICTCLTLTLSQLWLQALSKQSDLQRMSTQEESPGHELRIPSKDDISASSRHVGGNGYCLAAPTLRHHFRFPLHILWLGIQQLWQQQ